MRHATIAPAARKIRTRRPLPARRDDFARTAPVRTVMPLWQALAMDGVR
ncbi:MULTISPECIES: hypothetical protein [Streptomyces]|uniref:Uncharacterized protein n=2 Tax=Streptomyces TaxID=1883 RepID=A0ABV9J9M4_9ACTN